MPKNISIYIPDELLEKMNKFQEVNWSEIARNAIEDYTTGRIRIDERLSASEHYLNEIQIIRNQFTHDFERFRNIEKSTIEMNYEEKMNTEIRFRLNQPAELDITFKIFNLLDFDLLSDRFLYELRLSVQSRSIVNLKGKYLRRHSLKSSGFIRFSDQIKIDYKIVEAITNAIIENQEDVSWELTIMSYYNSDEGIIEHMEQKKDVIAYSAWTKWYYSWAQKFGLELR